MRTGARRSTVFAAALGAVLLGGCGNGVDTKGAVLINDFVYVASNLAGTIAAYRLNSGTGDLTPLPNPTVSAGTNPQFLVSDPANRFLYAANGGSNSISMFLIDPLTGSLTPIANAISSGGTGPTTLAIDPSGQFLYVLNFTDPSSRLTVFSIDPSSGNLTRLPANDLTFGGANLAFQLVFDPNSTFAYLSNVGGAVYAYQRGSNGTLTSPGITSFSAGSTFNGITIDPSSGYFYLAASASGKIYAGNVSGTALAATSPDSTNADAPGFIIAHPTLKAVYSGNISTASIKVHATNAARTALLASPQSYPIGTNINGLCLDATGRFLLVGEGSPGLSTFYVVPVDQTNGQLLAGYKTYTTGAQPKVALAIRTTLRN